MSELWLSRLELTGFRSHERAEFEFVSKFNGLVGDNGLGKTNVLEAIHYLSMGKPYFGGNDRQSVREGGDFFLIKALFSRLGRDEDLELAYAPAERKQMKRNGKPLDRLADHLGVFPAVVIAPRDQELVDGPAEERRRFADQVISQSDRTYLNALTRYQQLLKQRNALLRSAQGRDPGEQLAFFDFGLAQAAEELIPLRARFCDELRPWLEAFIDRIGGGEQASMVYQPDVEGSITEVLERNRAQDVRMGYTRRGLHKDEFEWSLDGRVLRHFGSQGQQKSFLLALKLAQYALLRSKLELTPLLLLDDLFDKLDARRAGRLIELLRTEEYGQVFVTDTHPDRISALFEGMGEEARIHRLTPTPA
ncbi:DNA replication and repair protein RecF [bacterium]|nr:DNA replication and repair protein RecF [bacterium]